MGPPLSKAIITGSPLLRFFHIWVTQKPGATRKTTTLESASKKKRKLDTINMY